MMELDRPIKFISTRGGTEPASFLEAMKRGLAGDGGLFMPDRIPGLSEAFWDDLEHKSFAQIAFEMSRPFIDRAISDRSLAGIIDSSFDFVVPLKNIEGHIYVLELFHGPTLAFKDFGARFMARMFAEISHDKKDDVVVLVATSGDTGSAVANGFFDVPGIDVCLLYPSGKISALQEKQMTTLGGNVTALEVDGTFDDCQSLVKEAFSDSELNDELTLTSANSINIARLLPQSFYYVYALSQLKSYTDKTPVFSVPSGNFGNMTGGLIADKMGMATGRFLAATNVNDAVPRYLAGDDFEPGPSKRTISNAMDVGNPSNFERIRYLFDYSDEKIRSRIDGYAFTDEQTRNCIERLYRDTGYITDPHTAVGYLAAVAHSGEEATDRDEPHLVLATAHPAKFKDVVEPLIDEEIPLPEQLRDSLRRDKKSVNLEPEYAAFSHFLMNRFAS